MEFAFSIAFISLVVCASIFIALANAEQKTRGK
jgi:HKD family nuclease